MKKEMLHLQILSYLKEQKEIINLEKVFKQFLNANQGLLIQDSISDCRGKDCFKRISAILFAINRLQKDNQIVLSHIDANIPQHNSNGLNQSIEIGNTISESNGKITGDYQKFLREYILSIIYVSEEADDYIRRRGQSKELLQAKRQTWLAWAAVIVAIFTLLATCFIRY